MAAKKKKKKTGKLVQINLNKDCNLTAYRVKKKML